MTTTPIEMLPGETEEAFLKRTFKARKARAEAKAAEMAAHLAALPEHHTEIGLAGARRTLRETRTLERMTGEGK